MIIFNHAVILSLSTYNYSTMYDILCVCNYLIMILIFNMHQIGFVCFCVIISNYYVALIIVIIHVCMCTYNILYSCHSEYKFAIVRTDN